MSGARVTHKRLFFTAMTAKTGAGADRAILGVVFVALGYEHPPPPPPTRKTYFPLDKITFASQIHIYCLAPTIYTM